MLDKLLRKEKGQGLVIVLCLVAIGGLMIVPLLNHMHTGLSSGQIYRERMALKYAAEAGLQDGMWKTDNDAVPLEPYDYATEYNYSLTEEINDKSVNVTIKQIWPLNGLESDANGTTPANALLITGGIISDSGEYEVCLSYADPEVELPIDKVAVWLPPGFAYVPSSSSGITTDDPTETEWNGGKTLEWDFDPAINFLDLPEQEPPEPLPGGMEPAVEHPVERSLNFNVTPAGELATGSYSWVRTTNSARYLSWESGITIYQINATASDDTTGKHTTTESYTYVSTGVVEGWLDTGGSLMTGDYRADGNTLMKDYNQDRRRETLLTDSSATINDIPSDAEVVFAYLYWSAWKDYSGSMEADKVCTFSIAPPDEDLILRPNAVGTYSQCDPYYDYPNYRCVDEETSDGNSTYVRTSSGATEIDTYNIDNHGSVSDTVNSITIHIRSRGDGDYQYQHSAETVIRTHDTDYFDSYMLLPYSYTGISTTYTVNPYTGSAWTWDEIDALEIGVRQIDGGNGRAYTTQVYAGVNHGETEYMTTILRPNATGDETSISGQYPDEGAHWDKVSEETADDFTSYVIAQGAAPANWYDQNWESRVPININHTNVADVADPATAYANLPVLVYATGLSGIKADGADIRFTASDGTTELPREIERYADGTLYAWVKVNLTKDSGDSSDDLFYMYYGNDAATEPAPDSTYGAENVWNSGFKMVQHLKDETISSTADSTSNDNDGAKTAAASPTETDGKISKAQDFDGSDDLINVADNASLDITSAITVEAWVKDDIYTWSGELLTNPGFEDGNFNGWTTHGWQWEVGPEGPYGSAGTHTGSYCAFRDNNSDQGDYIQQDADVSAYTTQIDAGTALCKAGGWTVSERYQENPTDDRCKIIIQYLNSAKELISTPLDTGWLNEPSWTEHKIVDDVIPVGTRYVRIWTTTEEEDWEDPSGSLDDFSVQVGLPRSYVDKGTDAYSLQPAASGTTLKGYISGNVITASVTNPTDWHHCVMTFDGTDQKLFIDGALENTLSPGGAIVTNAQDVELGSSFDGKLDEARISDTARSAEWIETEYNNQSAPSNFCVLGDEESATTPLYERDLYGIENHTISPEPILKVAVYFRFSGDTQEPDDYTAYAKAALKTHGVVYLGSEETQVGQGFITNSYEWPVNPYTGETWTWDEVDDLQAGLELKGELGAEGYCTQVYIEVSYYPFLQEEITADKWWLIENQAPDYAYSCFKDVTYLVKPVAPQGNATYNVGEVEGSTGSELSYAGWSLIIIYSSISEQGHQFFLYDQLMFAGTNASGSFTIEGFQAPPNASAELTCFVGEGDDWYNGDYLRFNDTYLSDATNPEDDVWNSKSSGLEGQLIEGVDIDTFDVSSPIISQGDTSAELTFTTAQDNWNLIYLILAFRSDLPVLTPSGTGIFSWGIGGG